MQSDAISYALRCNQVRSEAIRRNQTHSAAPDALPRPSRAACAASRARPGRARAPSRAARWPRAGEVEREGHRVRGRRPVWSTRRRASRVSPIGAMRLRPQLRSRRRRRRWRRKRRRRRRRRRRRQPPPLPAPPPPPLPAYQRMDGHESRAPWRERPRAASSPESIASARRIRLRGVGRRRSAPPCEARLRARRRLRMAIVPVGNRASW